MSKSKKNKKAFQEQEKLSSDVIKFCALVARIMIRCLKEKNPKVMDILFSSSQSEGQEKGGTHNAA